MHWRQSGSSPALKCWSGGKGVREGRARCLGLVGGPRAGFRGQKARWHALEAERLKSRIEGLEQRAWGDGREEGVGGVLPRKRERGQRQGVMHWRQSSSNPALKCWSRGERVGGSGGSMSPIQGVECKRWGGACCPA